MRSSILRRDLAEHNDHIFKYLLLRMSATGRSYTPNFFTVQYIIIQAILGRKSMKTFNVTDEKNSMSIRFLTVKNNSHAAMRISFAQLLEKGCQHGEEDFKNKICHKKSTSPVKSQDN